MRIIGKECKKILDVRLLLILCIFSALYYNIFMEITRYPSGGQMTASPHDIPFAAELVREIGPTLAVKDWSKIDDKIDELKEEFGKELSNYSALREEGITTYDELKKLEDDLVDKGEAKMSKKEKILYDEMSDAIFFSQKSSRIYFEIQYAKEMNEFEGMKYGASQNDID